MSNASSDVLELISHCPVDEKLLVFRALAQELLASTNGAEIPIMDPQGGTLAFLISAGQRRPVEQDLVAELRERVKSPGKTFTPEEVITRLQNLTK